MLVTFAEEGFPHSPSVWQSLWEVVVWVRGGFHEAFLDSKECSFIFYGQPGPSSSLVGARLSVNV